MKENKLWSVNKGSLSFPVWCVLLKNFLQAQQNRFLGTYNRRSKEGKNGKVGYQKVTITVHHVAGPVVFGSTGIESPFHFLY